jgi:tRNA (guanine37-N1)-methyltransferase
MTTTALDLTPPINRKMTELDRDFFQRKVSLVYAFFKDPKLVGVFTKNHPDDLLDLKRVKLVLKLGQDRGVLLNQNLHNVDDANKVLSGKALEFITQNNIPLKPYELTIGYDFWRSDEILTSILPEQFINEVPTGFTITGHVAHLNLREEFKPFGKLIGQVILDKNPNIRTVVDKLDTIHSVYRTFAMEVLAGDHDLIVEQRESNCVFRFDFEKVYWNSRLHTEHEKLVSKFKEGELVCDVMAGVGPFSVPAGKKKVFVISNDLNPDSYKYMLENITRNKVSEFVEPLNIDGRVLIQDIIKRIKDFSSKRNDLVKINKRRKISKDQPSIIETQEYPIPKFVSHFVMNLPDSALEFVNEYNGIYADYPEIRNVEGFQLPFVHAYCFEKFSPDEPEPSEEELHHRVFEKIKKIMQYDNLVFDEFSFHTVRKVAPTKPMFRVSFQLPEEVAFRKL